MIQIRRLLAVISLLALSSQALAIPGNVIVTSNNPTTNACLGSIYGAINLTFGTVPYQLFALHNDQINVFRRGYFESVFHIGQVYTAQEGVFAAPSEASCRFILCNQDTIVFQCTTPTASGELQQQNINFKR